MHANGQHTPAFQESVRLMVRLHYAMTNGDPDGPEADAIRDCMESPWYAMTASEQELVGGLSEDLYTIGSDRPCVGDDLGAINSQLAESLAAQSIDEGIVFLRQHQLELPSEQVAALRGMFWARLRQPEAARAFFEEAARIVGHTLIPS